MDFFLLDLNNFKKYLCLRVLPAWINVYDMCTWFPQRSEEGIKFSGTVVMDSFDPRYGSGNQIQVQFSIRICSIPFPNYFLDS